MKSRLKTWSIALILLGATSFALSADKAQKSSVGEKQPGPAPASQAMPKADFPVIGHLKNSERVITIKSGPNETLYSVKTPEGKLLFENVSAGELRAKAPEIHEQIKSGFAAKPRKSQPSPVTIDASLRAVEAR